MRRAPLAALVLALAPVPTAASCAPKNKITAHIRADVVFEGVAQAGPTAGDRAALASPVTFTDVEYRKGSGPATARVDVGTGPLPSPGASVTGPVSSNRIEPAAGQRWRIYARGNPGEVLQTSACDGSYRVGGPEPFESAGPSGSQIAFLALAISAALWAIFLFRWLASRRLRGR